MKTYRELYKDGVTALSAEKIENAEGEVRQIIENICSLPFAQFLLQADYESNLIEERRFYDAINLRCTHYPLQYILGNASFMGMDFMVNDHVLIPRQDTETLAETVLEKADISGGRLLDLCTGSGCLAISLLTIGHYAEATGTDISKEALETAGFNGAFAKMNWDPIDQKTKKLNFVLSDVFEMVEGKYDVIVSNPPYIPAEVIPTLMPEVRDHEPHLALLADHNGLAFYEKISAEAPDYLREHGWLFFEIGYDQAKAVTQIMTEAGFRDVTVVKDLPGLDRVVYGHL